MTSVHDLAAMVADLIRRYRQLWGGVCWALALLLCTFGVIDLVFGPHATSLPSAFAALTGTIPGGIHTFGGALTAAGLILIHGLANAWHRGEAMRDGWLHVALPFVGAVCASSVGLFAASWIMTGTKTVGGILTWTFAGVLTFLLWKIPPYPPHPPNVA